MQNIIPTLTERQRYWLEHIRACEASGKSMTEYAAAEGFPVRIPVNLNTDSGFI